MITLDSSTETAILDSSRVLLLFLFVQEVFLSSIMEVNKALVEVTTLTIVKSFGATSIATLTCSSSHKPLIELGRHRVPLTMLLLRNGLMTKSMPLLVESSLSV